MSEVSAILLTGCDQITDTRLVCDCDFTQDNRENNGSKTMCYSEQYDVNNNTLVFNELKKKFVWDGVVLDDYGTKWTDDSISWSFEDDTFYTWLRFNRINLIFTKTDSHKIKESPSDAWRTKTQSNFM